MEREFTAQTSQLCTELILIPQYDSMLNSLPFTHKKRTFKNTISGFPLKNPPGWDKSEVENKLIALKEELKLEHSNMKSQSCGKRRLKRKSEITKKVAGPLSSE